ncbi:MAG TPA: non-homologous end-joining DNA ligase [Thermoleophilaceae bacterium]|nr:non-homologous end-joining DNA ligase [Thermoleophilaceae bacterium]
MKVEVSRPGKLMFPKDGVTKGDLAGYYERVAEHLLLHSKGRPVSMQRFPDGIEGYGFFHKDVPDHFPDWVRRVEVAKRGGSVTHAVLWDADGLVYLADQACITPHVWLSRMDRVHQPDRLVIDLDPSVPDFAAVRKAALAAGRLLEELGLAPFAMATGSRGLHVWAPLRRGADYDQVKEFARGAARVLAARHPDELTVESRKAKRGDRILLDVARNAYAQTAVPPYAVRARPGAPVATPLEWKELSDSRLRPDRWNVKNVFRRLASKGDPWAEMGSQARGLAKPRKRLEALLREQA